MKRAVATFLALAVISGCALGPNYKRPTLDSPAAFRAENAATNSWFADLNWWQVYQDAKLQSLVREAFTNNYDLREAASRVEQARQIAAVARSQFYPNVDYSGAVSQGKNYLFAGVFPNGGSTAGSGVAALTAFWELDLWGRIRRLSESARAQYLASEEARRAVRLSLLGDVASDYLRLLELDEEYEITRRTTNSFGESLKFFTERLEGGKASDLETSRAEAALEDATAALPSILEQMSTTENELSVLLGRIPGPIARGTAGLRELPPEVPAGLPSALLERRPDIREMEQLLRSANAQVGEAITEFFPKIDLTALLGRISPELSAASLPSANAWGVGAAAAGPLFEGGRLVGQYRQAKAAREEARLRYRQTVLFALRDVSDALIERQRLAEIRDQQAREVAALERAVKTSTIRYLAGKATYYEVLEAQQQLFPAELNLARTRRDEQLAVVSLYEALGGGWQDETKQPPPTIAATANGR